MELIKADYNVFTKTSHGVNVDYRKELRYQYIKGTVALRRDHYILKGNKKGRKLLCAYTKLLSALLPTKPKIKRPFEVTLPD